MPVNNRRTAPPRKDTCWEIEKRETFQKMQKKFYQAGQKGKDFTQLLITIVQGNFSLAPFFTQGVITCLKKEYEKGKNEQNRRNKK